MSVKTCALSSHFPKLPFLPHPPPPFFSLSTDSWPFMVKYGMKKLMMVRGLMNTKSTVSSNHDHPLSPPSPFPLPPSHPPPPPFYFPLNPFLFLPPHSPIPLLIGTGSNQVNSLLKSLETESAGSLPMIRPGDASVAAPFTSR